MNTGFHSSVHFYISRSNCRLRTCFPRSGTKSFSNTMSPVVDFAKTFSVKSASITLQINVSITLNVSSITNYNLRSATNISSWVTGVRNGHNSTIQQSGIRSCIDAISYATTITTCSKAHITVSGFCITVEVYVGRTFVSYIVSGTNNTYSAPSINVSLAIQICIITSTNRNVATFDSCIANLLYRHIRNLLIS